MDAAAILTDAEVRTALEDLKERVKSILGTALAASALLADGGFASDAVSRLYFSLLSRIRALLLTLGLEPKSHEGAIRLLSLHFIKTGRLDPEASHLFSRLMKYREEADYNPSYLFTSDDYRRLCEETAALAAQIAELIRQAGYEKG